MSGFLNDIYPSRTWSVVVYNGESSSHFSSHSCLPGVCLAATNLLGRYNVFAVGIPTGSKANTKLLVSQGWRDFLASNPQNDAFTQLYNLEQKYCFGALLSLVGDHQPAWSLPDPAYYQLVSLNRGSNQVLAIGTTADAC